MRLALSAMLSASLLALAACSGGSPSAEGGAAAGATASAGPVAGAVPAAEDPLAPENAPHVFVVDPVVKLPAAPGNPGVLYFGIQQDGGKPGTLAAVHVDGVGRAEMHESVSEGGVTSMKTVLSVPFSKDKPAEFKPGGLHVMLFDVSATLKAGKETEVTFTLANGDKVSAFAKIEDAGGGMAGMDHM